MTTSSLIKNPLSLFWGILLCAALAYGASLLSKAAPFPAPTMMLCLFLGMAAHRFCARGAFQSGIDFTSKTLLRLGIVFIGARIIFDDFMALGWPVITTIITSIFGVIALGMIGARLFKLNGRSGFLLGGATAICGASAAMALSALLPDNKDTHTKTAQSIIIISAIGTIAMITYPFLLTGVLSFTESQAGLIIGGTIHDVAQVVGAGYTLSPEAGDSAVLVKLIRVAMLAPVLMICGLLIGMRARSNGDNNDTTSAPPLRTLLPPFLIGFAVLACLNSAGLIPHIMQAPAKEASSFLLKMALVAIGIKTSFSDIKAMGWRPIALAVSLTLMLLAVYIALIRTGVVLG